MFQVIFIRRYSSYPFTVGEYATEHGALTAIGIHKAAMRKAGCTVLDTDYSIYC